MEKVRKKVEFTGVTPKFPIEMNISVYGTPTVKKINRGDVVKCWWCGKEITVNSRTAFAFEENEYVHCPHCEKNVSVFYYMGNVIKKASENYKEEDEEKQI